MSAHAATHGLSLSAAANYYESPCRCAAMPAVQDQTWGHHPCRTLNCSDLPRPSSYALGRHLDSAHDTRTGHVTTRLRTAGKCDVNHDVRTRIEADDGDTG